MRREVDALMSVQRYMAQQAFPAPWDVRRDEEMGDEPLRPYVLVEFVGALAADAGTRAGNDVTLAVAVNAYLPQAPTRQAAKDATLALREIIYRAVRWGPDPRNPTPDRLPLWDFDETTVPVGATVPFRNHCDYMRVASFGQSSIYDDVDPRLAQVAVDLRLTYRRPLPVPFWKMAQGIVASGGPED